QNQLAKGLGMDKSAVVAIIDDLEARGLASRVRGTQDRRRHALTLTPEGEALTQRMYGVVSQVGLPMREALSKREFEQLLSLLDRAYEALSHDGRAVGAQSGKP
ncbi:MAG: MarR family winged helix-turn-helix transcriptional regulator, partial [Alphaproteobacteria bacterium]